MDMSNIAKYLYEIGQLKRVKRSGWWMAEIVDPESVAEHS
jgi:putative hydrolases of HD superfamily